jgi:hypothetical protein
MTKRLATVDKAWTDPKLLDLGDASLLTWRACMKAAHAEPLSAADGAQSFVVTREMVENVAIAGALRRMRTSPQTVFGERRWGQMQRA